MSYFDGNYIKLGVGSGEGGGDTTVIIFIKKYRLYLQDFINIFLRNGLLHTLHYETITTMVIPRQFL